MGVLKGDFIGFQLGKNHSSGLGIVRVSDGSRYSEDLAPVLSDKTVQRPGSDGTYFFNSYYTQKPFEIPFAFDSLTEQDLRKLRQVFNEKTPQELIFDERPYKSYLVKISSSPNLRYICFDEGGQRIYKGEGTLALTAYYPYAKSVYKWLDQYNNENLEEWADSSGLKKTNEGYDKFRQSGTTNENYICNIYNAGDIPTDYKLKFMFPKITKTINEKEEIITEPIGSEDGFTISLNGDLNSQIEFSQILPKGSDDYIIYNTANNLVEGYYIDKNNNHIRSGHIYNNHKIKGIFFKLPIGESTLEITGLQSGYLFSDNPIDYSYLYY